MTTDSDSTYHIPVLLKEATTYFITNPHGIYVDGTVGGGGHAEYILKNHKKIKQYIAIDQDREALQVAEKRLNDFRQIHFRHSNFSQFDRVLKELNLPVIDGFLLDLGVASYQIETVNRGFSYMQSSPLDMRMNQEDQMTAADIVNDWSEQELARIFYEYGEEKKSRQIARSIVFLRNKAPITSSEQLKKIVGRVIHPRFAVKSYARIFQALRIAVNQELDHLQTFLKKSMHFLNSGGRIVIISYHSLEDRMVKKFFKTLAFPCTCPPEFPECVCGKNPVLKIITKKPVRAGSEEMAVNPRSRSALLRVGEKI